MDRKYTLLTSLQEQEFAESKIATGNGGQSQDNYSRQVATADAEEFKNILDGIDYEFPFL